MRKIIDWNKINIFKDFIKLGKLFELKFFGFFYFVLIGD